MEILRVTINPSSQQSFTPRPWQRSWHIALPATATTAQVNVYNGLDTSGPFLEVTRSGALRLLVSGPGILLVNPSATAAITVLVIRLATDTWFDYKYT